MSKDLSMDFQFNNSAEQVWNALTDSDMLAKWVMDNDFKPVVGHRFQFSMEATGGWDGKIDCEVLDVDEPHRLSYTWVSFGESHTITWTINEDKDGTTHLHLDEMGISNDKVYQGAKYGWTNMCGKLEELLQ